MTARVEGDRGALVEAIRNFAAHAEYEATLTESGAAAIVSLRLRARGWRRLGAHPSRIDAMVAETGDALLFAMDRGWSRWYALHCFAMCVAAGVLLIGGFNAIDPGKRFEDNVTAVCAVLIGLICVLRGWDLIGAGTLPMAMLGDAVRRAAERSGGSYEPLVETSARYSRAAYAYGSFVALLLLAAFASDARTIGRVLLRDAFALFIVTFLLALVLIAFALLVASRRFRGFERRITPMLPPLLIVGAFLMLSSPMLFPRLAGEGQFARRARGLIERSHWPQLDASSKFRQLPPAKQQAVRNGFAFLRAFAAAVLLATLFLFLMCAAALIYACRSAYRHLPEYFSIAGETEIGDIARNAQGFQAPFRRLARVIWLACAAIVLAAAAGHLLTFLAAVQPALAPASFRNAVDETTTLISLLLRQPLDRSASIARCAHFALASLGVLFWMLPPLDLFRSRRSARRRLEAASLHSSIAGVVDRLAERGGVAVPLVAVQKSEVPWAAATVFGARAYLHLSTRILTLLTEAEQEAVIAHELAHLALGHCRRDVALLWLGRLTLVGDSFMRVTQQTVANESAADVAALSRFGAAPESLRSALAKVRNVAAAEAPPLFATGIPFSAAPMSRYLERQEYLALPFGEQLRLGARALYQFYVCGGSRAYWHPDPKSRARAIRQWSAGPT
jgi:Zn-dependent protease with chaperone function